MFASAEDRHLLCQWLSCLFVKAQREVADEFFKEIRRAVSGDGSLGFAVRVILCQGTSTTADEPMMTLNRLRRDFDDVLELLEYGNLLWEQQCAHVLGIMRRMIAANREELPDGHQLLRTLEWLEELNEHMRPYFVMRRGLALHGEEHVGMPLSPIWPAYAAGHYQELPYALRSLAHFRPWLFGMQEMDYGRFALVGGRVLEFALLNAELRERFWPQFLREHGRRLWPAMHAGILRALMDGGGGVDPIWRRFLEETGQALFIERGLSERYAGVMRSSAGFAPQFQGEPVEGVPTYYI